MRSDRGVCGLGVVRAQLTGHAVTAISTAGRIVKRALLPGGRPFEICTDADGGVWFTVQGDGLGTPDAIGRITS